MGDTKRHHYEDRRQCPVLHAPSAPRTGSLDVPGAVAGNGYYLSGKFQALDSPDEWYRDPTSGLLYLWTPTGDSPAGHLVEAKHRQFGFNLNNHSYISIKGINLFACTISTSKSSFISIDKHLRLLHFEFQQHRQWLQRGGNERNSPVRK